MQKSTSWGSVAGWYDELLEKEGTYQKEVILPNLLRLVEPRPGKTVVDLACGQGFFSRALAAKGAKVLASDISKELIEIAKKQSMKNIDYQVAPAQRADFVKSGTADAVVIVLAMQNIENVLEVLKECARILKPTGKLFLVLNHPAFRVPKASDWQYDEKLGIQYRRVAEYLSEAKIPIEMHPGKKTGEETITFHRPLQLYFKHLAKTGFCVKRLEEWETHKKSTPGPRAKAEDRAKKEIPMFLMLEANKS